MMVVGFDVDNLVISAPHHMWVTGSLTTLAQDLKPGDTTVYLTSAANWYNGGTAGVSTHLRSFIFWNYKNSYGYEYPPETYSRNWYGNMWNPGGVNTTSNTITLITAWTGQLIPAGTKLSNGSSGGSYKYIALVGTKIPTVWTSYSSNFGELDLSGNNVSYKFAPGTAFCKIGWLWNYNSAAGEQAWITNLNFSKQLNNKDNAVSATKLLNARLLGE